MAPPRRYTDRDIIEALRVSRSLKMASDISGMSMGAMRKRIGDPEVYRAWRDCRARGLANIGTIRLAAPEGE